MGGRGGSSGIRATGGGGNFPTQDLAKMSMVQLRELDSKFNSAIQAQENIKSEELGKREHPWDTPSKKYYNAQEKKVELQDAQRNVVKEIVRRKSEEAKKQKNTKTFVNSFGEATTRNITTSSYERWKKKIAKRFMR